MSPDANNYDIQNVEC